MISLCKLSKYVLTSAFCLAAECLFAQQLSLTARLNGYLGISPRWTMLASVEKGFEMGSSKSQNLGGVLGAQFNVYGNVFVYAGAQYASAFYPSFDGTNDVFALREGVNIVTENLFVHCVELEQRWLSFWQIENKVYCTRGTYSFSKVLKLNDNWQFLPRVFVKLNGKSEVKESNLLQRAGAEVAIRRVIWRNICASLAYSYRYGGRLQTYIADRHNMHTLTLKFDVGNRKMY